MKEKALLMTKSRFRHLLHAGRGAAIQHARRNQVPEYREVILDACLHNHAVDPQAEGTHADYIYRLLAVLQDRPYYVERVIAALENSGDDWDAVHRFCLATYFAIDDANAGAREAIHRNYTPGPAFGEHIGLNIVQMDGIPGFLSVARRIGALLRDPANRVDEGWLFSFASKNFGEDTTLAALRGLAPADASLAAYLERVTTPHSDQVRAMDPLLESSFDELMAMIGTPAERRALVALKRFSHPDLRALAFRLVESRSPNRDMALGVLRRHFQPEDVETALTWHRAETDPDVRHRQEISLRLLAEEQQDHATEILHTVYEYGACSDCRGWAVRELINRNAMPTGWLIECADDANEQTRELAARHCPPTPKT